MRIVVTPSCPVCGSKKTGYFVAGNDPELKEKYFLKGERIRLRSVPNGKNCFCADCGMEWRDQLFKKRISEDDFETYLLEHGFKAQRKQYKEKRKYKEELTEEQKKRKKEKRKNIFQFILLMCTGIDVKRRKKKKDSE